MSKASLKRSLNLPMMILYGLGTTIGAGIYALIGEIAGIAGIFSPFSFLIASVLAGLTALSFAELCGRYPRAAGAALYVKMAFKHELFSTVIGLFVVLAGLVSAAALLNGFVNHLGAFIALDRYFLLLLLASCLCGLAIWGIAESVTAAALLTLLEVGGLCLVIAASTDVLSTVPHRIPELIPTFEFSVWHGIFSGAILSFYAFIGFEDMVDVAEEVKDVRRTLPLAILITLGLTTFLYVTLMMVAVLSVEPEALSEASIPLAFLYEHNSGTNPIAIILIGMFAVLNGALIQLIMASRVLYGLSFRHQLPAFLHEVNQRTQTPIYATLIATSCLVGFALIGSLASLAKATSIIILIVFSIINLALCKLKMEQHSEKTVLNLPIFIPVLGFISSLFFVALELFKLIDGV